MTFETKSIDDAEANYATMRLVDAYEAMVYAQNRHNENINRAESRKTEDDQMRKSYHVTGMGCEACVRRVNQAVGALDGVRQVLVDLSAETLTVEYDENKADFETL